MYDVEHCDSERSRAKTMLFSIAFTCVMPWPHIRDTQQYTIIDNEQYPVSESAKEGSGSLLRKKENTTSNNVIHARPGISRRILMCREQQRMEVQKRLKERKKCMHVCERGFCQSFAKCA